MSNASNASFRDRALVILSGREHSAEELRQKLVGKGCPDETAQDLVDEFTSLGYLDDVRFGIMLTRAKVRLGWGAQRIKSELLRRGVRGESMVRVLQECAEELTADAEYSRASEIARKRVRTSSDVERVYRYLVSHGFSSACACQVLEQYRRE